MDSSLTPEDKLAALEEASDRVVAAHAAHERRLHDWRDAALAGRAGIPDLTKEVRDLHDSLRNLRRTLERVRVR